LPTGGILENPFYAATGTMETNWSYAAGSITPAGPTGIDYEVKAIILIDPLMM
jgi:hypothetical protein